MFVMLAWLTASLPFVYAAEQAQKETTQKQYNDTEAEDESNSLNNTTEEKAGSVNTISEYLHDTHALAHPDVMLARQYHVPPFEIYIAYHPELICPPPNIFTA